MPLNCRGMSLLHGHKITPRQGTEAQKEYQRRMLGEILSSVTSALTYSKRFPFRFCFPTPPKQNPAYYYTTPFNSRHLTETFTI